MNCPTCGAECVSIVNPAYRPGMKGEMRISFCRSCQQGYLKNGTPCDVQPPSEPPDKDLPADKTRANPDCVEFMKRRYRGGYHVASVITWFAWLGGIAWMAIPILWLAVHRPPPGSVDVIGALFGGFFIGVILILAGIGKTTLMRATIDTAVWNMPGVDEDTKIEFARRGW